MFNNTEDEIFHLLIPQSPVYPNSKLYVPVFLEQPRAAAAAPGADRRGEVRVVEVRANARKGSRIVGVEEASANWTIR